MRPTFEQVKKILEKMNPHKVSPVDMMMNLVCILSCQAFQVLFQFGHTHTHTHTYTRTHKIIHPSSLTFTCFQISSLVNIQNTNDEQK